MNNCFTNLRSIGWNSGKVIMISSESKKKLGSTIENFKENVMKMMSNLKKEELIEDRIEISFVK